MDQSYGRPSEGKPDLSQPDHLKTRSADHTKTKFFVTLETTK